jgi:hypothetical protein
LRHGSHRRHGNVPQFRCVTPEYKVAHNGFDDEQAGLADDNVADRALVLCEPLCFILNKNGKLQIIVLKNAVQDVYDRDTLAEAESHFVNDSGSLPLSDTAYSKTTR